MPGRASARNARARTAGKGRKFHDVDDDLIAWALVGLATVANIGSALGVPGKRQRSQLYTSVGNLLIESKR